MQAKPALNDFKNLLQKLYDQGHSKKKLLPKHTTHNGLVTNYRLAETEENRKFLELLRSFTVNELRETMQRKKSEFILQNLMILFNTEIECDQEKEPLVDYLARISAKTRKEINKKIIDLANLNSGHDKLAIIISLCKTKYKDIIWIEYLKEHKITIDDIFAILRRGSAANKIDYLQRLFIDEETDQKHLKWDTLIDYGFTKEQLIKIYSHPHETILIFENLLLRSSIDESFASDYHFLQDKIKISAADIAFLLLLPRKKKSLERFVELFKPNNNSNFDKLLELGITSEQLLKLFKIENSEENTEKLINFILDDKFYWLVCGGFNEGFNSILQALTTESFNFDFFIKFLDAYRSHFFRLDRKIELMQKLCMIVAKYDIPKHKFEEIDTLKIRKQPTDDLLESLEAALAQIPKSKKSKKRKASGGFPNIAKARNTCALPPRLETSFQHELRQLKYSHSLINEISTQNLNPVSIQIFLLTNPQTRSILQEIRNSRNPVVKVVTFLKIFIPIKLMQYPTLITIETYLSYHYITIDHIRQLLSNPSNLENLINMVTQSSILLGCSDFYFLTHHSKLSGPALVNLLSCGITPEDLRQISTFGDKDERLLTLNALTTHLMPTADKIMTTFWKYTSNYFPKNNPIILILSRYLWKPKLEQFISLFYAQITASNTYTSNFNELINQGNTPEDIRDNILQLSSTQRLFSNPYPHGAIVYTQVLMQTSHTF